MKVLLIFLLGFGLFANAEDVDLRTRGFLKVYGEQTLPNEKNVQEVVINNDPAHLMLYAKCSIFGNCKKFALKIYTPNSIFNIKLTESAFNDLAEMKDPGFEKGHTVVSEDGLYMLSSEGKTREISRHYEGYRVAGLCRYESYCVEWVTQPNGQSYCRRWVERQICDPDRYYCEEIVESETDPKLEIRNTKNKELMVVLSGDTRRDTAKRDAPLHYCRY